MRFREELARLVEATEAWNAAEDKPFSHEVWIERMNTCQEWRDALAAARSLLASANAVQPTPSPTAVVDPESKAS